MPTERSDKVYETYRQAVEKFDYFILGVTGALCAYISQVYKPAQVGLNPGTLELLALLILVAAAVTGFRRVESTIQVTSLNHRYLRAQEQRGALISKANGGHLINESSGDILSPDMVAHQVQLATEAISALHTQLERARDAAQHSYGIRNALLFVGFSTLVAAKVWSAYV
jgi:hypothetical protein